MDNNKANNSQKCLMEKIKRMKFRMTIIVKERKLRKNLKEEMNKTSKQLKT